MNLETGENRPVHSAQLNLQTDIRFSARQRRLALTTANQICVIDIDTGHLKPVTERDVRAMLEDWSPDGQRILYTRGRELWILNLESQEDAPLLHDGEIVEGRDARWSPAGEPIAFSSEGNIYSVRSDGTELRRLTNHDDSRSAWHPRWVLGGAHLVYSLIDEAGKETRIMTPDGSRDGRVPVIIESWEPISPDFLETIVLRPLPENEELFVLFVRTLDDPTSTAFRQLTSYPD